MSIKITKNSKGDSKKMDNQVEVDGKENNNNSCNTNKNSSGKDSMVSTTSAIRRSMSPCSTVDSASTKSLYRYQMDKINNSTYSMNSNNDEMKASDYSMSADSRSKKIHSQPSFLNDGDGLVYMNECHEGYNDINGTNNLNTRKSFKKTKVQKNNINSGNNDITRDYSQYKGKTDNDIDQNANYEGREEDDEEMEKSPTPKRPLREFMNKLDKYDINNSDNAYEDEGQKSIYGQFHNGNNYEYSGFLIANENSQSWQNFGDNLGTSSMYEKRQNNGKASSDRIPTRGCPTAGDDRDSE
ncbi:hypothetical protein ACO0QE_004327 [Hanseniaspora vineae]